MNYFNAIVKWVLERRTLVLTVGLLIFFYGIIVTINTPVDILPDLNRPTVTIFIEAEGLATEEVETLATKPVEAVMNGAPGVERVRSISSVGLALVFVEFDWKQDIYIARQIVSEKLQGVALPDGVDFSLGPISSIMGEIQLIGISSRTGETSPKELRVLADWTVRQKLLTIPGISKVTNMGGEIQEYQIKVHPSKLANFGLTITELEEKVEAAAENRSGGFISTDETEFPIRVIGRTTDVEILKQTVIAEHEGTLVYLSDVATFEVGSQFAPRGSASINGKPGVLLSITKQPGVNTLRLTKLIEEELKLLESSFNDDIELHLDLFKQEKFIQNGLDNVIGASRDAAILVVIILIFFLGNIRAIGITLAALPFSFVTAILIMRLFGMDINVMTLGGLAVAIGELTDDAVVGVENTIRWLRENKKKKNPISTFQAVLKASSEVRGSIIFSTVLVVLVFMPLFALSGIEGKLLAPLGIAYIVALIASTIVALTISSALAYILLPGSSLIDNDEDTFLVRKIKAFATPIIRWNVRNTRVGLLIAFFSIFGTIILVSQAGKEFLPPFNEGTLTINVALPPGSSLEKSNEVGGKVEQALLAIPEVKSTARRTGRAEEDEHANGVNVSELEVDIDIDSGRDQAEIINHVKSSFSELDLEGANVSIGQPISHRIEHILSGVRAPIVIKLFGSDLEELQTYGEQIRSIMEDIPGALNPVLEQEVSIPQVTITPKRERLAQYGFVFGEFTEMLEVILAGEEIGKILEGDKSFKLVLRLDESILTEPEKLDGLLIRTPRGSSVPLSALADIRLAEGQNSISHDNGQRRIVISSGILGSDSVTIIEELKQRVEKELDLPTGYFISYEGSYKSQQESSRRLLIYTMLALVGIIASLYYKFRSVSLVAQVLVNVPVTYFGAMIAVLVTSNVISLASLVGLISILGLAARNGILLIEHWIYMATEEGMPFNEELIVKGSLNRLVPMLMTSLTSMLALIPLLLSPTAPGKEILYPLAVTTFGGLLTSTLVEIIIRPGMFKRFGEKSLKRAVEIYNQSNNLS